MLGAGRTEAMEERPKRPGETAFALILLGVSVFLLWKAFGISGFSALSSAGAFPLAVSAVMVVTAVMIVVATIRREPAEKVSFFKAILPPVVVVMTVLIGGYAFLLEPLGFLPTSALFLFLAMVFLRHGKVVSSFGYALAGLAGVYVVFRLVFTVLMPEGVVPERELIAKVERWIEAQTTPDDPEAAD